MTCSMVWCLLTFVLSGRLCWAAVRPLEGSGLQDYYIDGEPFETPWLPYDACRPVEDGVAGIEALRVDDQTCFWLCEASCWGSWMPFGECSTSQCGGRQGFRTRYRKIRPECQGVMQSDTCAGMEVSTERCWHLCANGGTSYEDGTCACPDGFGGECCKQSVLCPSLTPCEHGEMSYTNGRQNGSVTTTWCERGYQVEGNATRRCHDGAWQGEAPLCLPVDCPLLSNIGHGNVTYSADLQNGSMATYECDSGYTLEGAATRLCWLGLWEDQEPVCVQSLCPELVDLNHGAVIYNRGREEGSLASYSCNSGFSLVGDATRLCQQGVWAGEQPECRLACVLDCHGLGDGDYQSCRGCHVYASCVAGLLYDNRPCPAHGLVWDDSTKTCQYVSTTCSEPQK